MNQARLARDSICELEYDYEDLVIPEINCEHLNLLTEMLIDPVNDYLRFLRC